MRGWQRLARRTALTVASAAIGFSGFLRAEAPICSDPFFEAPLKYPLIPYASGEFGGEPVFCQIDTGCSITVVHARYRDLLGDPGGTEIAAVGGGGSIRVETFQAPSLSVKGFRAPVETVAALDLSDFSDATGLDHPILLGCDAVKGGALVFDFDRETLLFCREAAIADSNDEWTSFDMTLVHDAPHVVASIDSREVKFLIDTGSTGGIELDTETFTSLLDAGVIEEGRASKSLTAGGLSRNRAGKFTDGSLFGRELAGTEAAETEAGSTLGMEFLCHFNFIVDFAGLNFAVDPREGFQLVEPQEILGMAMVYPGGIGIVHALKPEDLGPSAARNAGIEVRDQIVGLGPLKRGEITMESVYRLLAGGKDGEIAVRIRRGEAEEVISLQIQRTSE